jgi:very-short-patch-repair endonuclease
MLAYRPQLEPLSRRLRAAMSGAEHRLWFHLRRKLLLGGAVLQPEADRLIHC